MQDARHVQHSTIAIGRLGMTVDRAVEGPARDARPQTADSVRVEASHPLQRALREVEALRRRLRAAEAALDHLDCAVFVLDRRAAMFQANRAALRLLAEGDGLGCCGKVLCARINGDAAALRALVANVASPHRGRPSQVLRIRRGGDRPPLIALAPADAGGTAPCHPDERLLLLFVADPARRRDVGADLLRDAFGLTDREVSVALAAARLGSLPAAAAQLGIALTTARSHLQHVFDKTGTRNQVALAQMLASLSVLPMA